MIADRRAFILEHTRLQSPPHVPELRLHLADDATPLWRLTEPELEALGLPAPFWAFAWAGGQGLARYLLDHPDEARGRRVIDFAAGSGLAAIAAMQAGAGHALASDIDDVCSEAVARNAEANGVEVDFTDLILAGDICYEAPLADRVMAWLSAARDQGARVLVGDPGRTYFPKAGLRRLAEYRTQTPRGLEDQEVRKTGVWELT